MVSAATGGTPHSSAASSFSHRVMSLGGASATGCSVCTRGDRDEGGGGREREGGGRVGVGWGGVWVRKERGRRAILSCCGPECGSVRMQMCFYEEDQYVVVSTCKCLCMKRASAW